MDRDDPIDAARALALEMADRAGAITRGYFRTDVTVDNKDDASPVTIADREAEAAMREAIEARFPEHGIIGEEHGSERADAEFVWVLDPIDGTKQFVTGNPGYGTLIGLARRGRPVLGVIDMPMKRERWVGAEGHPTLFTDHRGTAEARVGACSGLAEAVLTATSPEMFESAGAEAVAAFDRLRGAARFTVYGNDCYAYGLLASGYLDLVVETSLGVYDYIALAPVVEGAGGIITDWAGAPLGIDSGRAVVAAGDAAVHRAALALLRGDA